MINKHNNEKDKASMAMSKDKKSTTLSFEESIFSKAKLSLSDSEMGNLVKVAQDALKQDLKLAQVGINVVGDWSNNKYSTIGELVEELETWLECYDGVIGVSERNDPLNAINKQVRKMEEAKSKEEKGEEKEEI